MLLSSRGTVSDKILAIVSNSYSSSRVDESSSMTRESFSGGDVSTHLAQSLENGEAVEAKDCITEKERSRASLSKSTTSTNDKTSSFIDDN